MAILTKSGRAAIAASIKKQPIHLAWGTGDPLWETSFELEKTFSFNLIRLEHRPVKNVVIMQDGNSFTAGRDYNVDSVTGEISRITTGNILNNAKLQIYYTHTAPTEPITASRLINEVGRKLADEILFCEADKDGELITPTGRFRASSTPTNNLYLKFNFDFEHASNKTIRELGVMVGSKTDPKLPIGQRYFLPSEIIDPGILLVLEYTVPLIRTAATRESFSFVVTF